MTLRQPDEQESPEVAGSDATMEELRSVPLEALVEIIIHQREIIGGLHERIAELEREIVRLSKPRKTSRNSSLPPSKEPKPNRKTQAKPKKKRGPRVGHPGHS